MMLPWESLVVSRGSSLGVSRGSNDVGMGGSVGGQMMLACGSGVN